MTSRDESFEELSSCHRIRHPPDHQLGDDQRRRNATSRHRLPGALTERGYWQAQSLGRDQRLWVHSFADPGTGVPGDQRCVRAAGNARAQRQNSIREGTTR